MQTGGDIVDAFKMAAVEYKGCREHCQNLTLLPFGNRKLSNAAFISNRPYNLRIPWQSPPPPGVRYVSLCCQRHTEQVSTRHPGLLLIFLYFAAVACGYFAEGPILIEWWRSWDVSQKWC